MGAGKFREDPVIPFDPTLSCRRRYIHGRESVNAGAWYTVFPSNTVSSTLA